LFVRLPRYVEHNQYDCIVALLAGIRRYREMEYLLDILYDSDRFELMLTRMVPPPSPLHNT